MARRITGKVGFGSRVWRWVWGGFVLFEVLRSLLLGESLSLLLLLFLAEEAFDGDGLDSFDCFCDLTCLSRFCGLGCLALDDLDFFDLLGDLAEEGFFNFLPTSVDLALSSLLSAIDFSTVTVLEDDSVVELLSTVFPSAAPPAFFVFLALLLDSLPVLLALADDERGDDLTFFFEDFSTGNDDDVDNDFSGNDEAVVLAGASSAVAMVTSAAAEVAASPLAISISDGTALFLAGRRFCCCCCFFFSGFCC